MDWNHQQEYIDWLARDQMRKRLVELPGWVIAERYDHVEPFLKWWYHGNEAE